MRTIIRALCTAALVLAATAAARANPPAGTDTTRASVPSPTLAPVEPPVPVSFQDYMLRDRFGAGTPNYLSMTLDVTSMQWYRTPTRFEAVMNGAGAAATLGMFIGALGTTFDWFDEDTSWWVTGAMATAGALYGGMRYQPQAPGLRYRIGFEREP
jgi:hypothetical protein